MKKSLFAIMFTAAILIGGTALAERNENRTGWHGGGAGGQDEQARLAAQAAASDVTLAKVQAQLADAVAKGASPAAIAVYQAQVDYVAGASAYYHAACGC